MKKTGIIFIERNFPSSNMILINDENPTIIDPGFGSDVKETEMLIKKAGIMPENLSLIVNTHYHCDHVGANSHLQLEYGIKVAAHTWDASLINSCDSEACSAEWLNQPIERYRVEEYLTDGDEISTGNLKLKVFHTPGHTLGHISLYEPEGQILICGDLFHKNDIGWINIFREGVSSIQQSLESLDRLSTLSIQTVYSGHGPQIENPKFAIDAALRRFEKFLQNPEKSSWHSCKRIFAYNLMINNGFSLEKVENYLLECGWFQDFARYSFQLQPEEFVQVLLDEMIRSGAACWNENQLIATTPHQTPRKDWLMKKHSSPKNWFIH